MIFLEQLQQQWRRFMRNRQLIASSFRPGFGLKRWLGVMFAGIFLLGFSMALMLQRLSIHALSWLDFFTLNRLSPWMRVFLFLGLGLIVVTVAIWQVNRRIVLAMLPGERKPRNIEIVSSVLRRSLDQSGPRIVAIGGGTGMPQLLRGLQQYTDNITAVVTVADDGGSSGRLRSQFQTLPPGDFRNNIAALSDAEDLMLRLFQYRFADRDLSANLSNGSSELAGHSFGNLFITTMGAVTGGFERGLEESSRVLAVRGRILPSTLQNVRLCAEVAIIDETGKEAWSMVEGESNIPESGGKVRRVFLQPSEVNAYPAVIQEILKADMIIAGPGSFFTSVMPDLLVPDVRDAICASQAVRIYVCNVATQPGETDDYSVGDHMRQLWLHSGEAFTTVLANDNYDLSHPLSSFSDWVPISHHDDDELDTSNAYQLFTGDIIDDDRPWRHDSNKLATRLMEIYAELSTQNTAAVK